MLGPAHLHAADLAADGLGQFGDELDAPHALVGRQALAREGQDGLSQFGAGWFAGHQGDEGLGHGQTHRVGAGHDGDFGHRRVLDQAAFQLERADAVVAGLEHVVGAADEGDVAVGVARGGVAGAVAAVAHHFRGLLGAVLVGLHQAQRAHRQVQRHLALVGRMFVDVEQHHLVAGKRAPHAAGLDGLAGRVADLRRGLGLAEAVAQGQAPGVLHLVNDLGVERLASADHLAQCQPAAPGRQVFLDQHAPHGGRRAQAGDLVLLQHAQQRRGREARVVEDEDGGARVPGREEAAPRMLGPAGRADVEVHVARLQADPVHGAEVTHRVALVRVQHQLGLGRGAAGEVKQQRIGGLGGAVGREGGGHAAAVVEVQPARHRRADRNAGVAAGQRGKLGGVLAGHHHVAHVAALQPVLQIVGRKQHGGRDHHRAELDAGQHQLPQRQLVAQHQQHAVAAAHALGTQPVGDLVGAFAELRKAALHLAAVLAHDVQGRGFVAARHGVEVVERPVERAQLRPAEVAVGGGVVGAVLQQEVARRDEGAGLVGHGGVSGVVVRRCALPHTATGLPDHLSRAATHLAGSKMPAPRIQAKSG